MALAWWVDGGFLRQQKPSRMALAWRVAGVLLRQQKPSRMALARWVDGALLVWRVGGAFWADGLPAADSPGTCIPWSAPPVRSAATAHRTPSFCQEQELPHQHPPKFAPHNKTPIKVRGTDYPSLEAPIIGGRQA